MALDPDKIPINFDTIQQVGSTFLPVAPSNLLHLTTEELAAYNGKTEGQPIYIALMGNIYNVTNGSTFYGPGDSIYFYFFNKKVFIY